MTTAGGTRYLELEEGRGEGVKRGDTVEIYFKVLKLGKRSYDGLSGEGTVCLDCFVFGWMLHVSVVD